MSVTENQSYIFGVRDGVLETQVADGMSPVSTVTPVETQEEPRITIAQDSSGNEHVESTITLSVPMVEAVTTRLDAQDTTQANHHAYQLNTISTGKHKNQYMMPNGRIVNGKGLGRGRPGIKRGPRRSKLATELNVDSASNDSTGSRLSMTPAQTEDSTPSTSKGKRKRADSSSSVVKVEDNDDDDDDDLSFLSRSSTPEYNPTSTHTRSGRPLQRPATVAVSSTSQLDSSGMSNSPASTSTPTVPRPPPASVASPSLKKGHPKIKPKIYRGREAFALCEHCLRGVSPLTNPIVFCDACNKCWHQRCHRPHIPQEVVADVKAKWFCVECDRILNPKKKKTTAKGGTKNASIDITRAVQTPVTPAKVQQAPQSTSSSNSGSRLTLTERKEYLGTLSKERLIELLLKVTDSRSSLNGHEEIFPTEFAWRTTPSSVPTTPLVPTYTSSYVTPVDPRPYTLNISSIDSKNATNNFVSDVGLEDAGIDENYDEYAMLYPEPGMGVALPPEREDLAILLEGPRCTTFSHWVRGMDMKTVVEGVR